MIEELKKLEMDARDVVMQLQGIVAALTTFADSAAVLAAKAAAGDGASLAAGISDIRSDVKKLLSAKPAAIKG